MIMLKLFWIPFAILVGIAALVSIFVFITHVIVLIVDEDDYDDNFCD